MARKITPVAQNYSTVTFIEDGSDVEVWLDSKTGDTHLVTFDREEFLTREVNYFHPEKVDGHTVIVYGSTFRAARNRMAVRDAEVGDFLAETLVTDTRVWEVVGRTAKTLKVRATTGGEILKREEIDGNPWPVVFTEAVSCPEAEVVVARLRKDGTYRLFGHGNALRPAATIDGKPVTRVDYRY